MQQMQHIFGIHTHLSTSRELRLPWIIERIFLALPLLCLRYQERREGKTMNATSNEARIAGYAAVAEKAASSDVIRLAQYGWLNEMPGLVFGLITLAYIATQLIALR
jgi:hypothetical protein